MTPAQNLDEIHNYKVKIYILNKIHNSKLKSGQNENQFEWDAATFVVHISQVGGPYDNFNVYLKSLGFETFATIFEWKILASMSTKYNLN